MEENSDDEDDMVRKWKIHKEFKVINQFKRTGQNDWKSKEIKYFSVRLGDTVFVLKQS